MRFAAPGGTQVAAPLPREDIRIVLVSPEGEANMGAVARTMACFGVSDLVLVTPYRQPADEAAAWACHAQEVLAAARVAASLDEALEGVNLAVALTRRGGKRRHRMHSPTEFLREVLPGYPPGRVALVFGPEESGLANEHLDRCHRLVHIPTAGSLNLSHAVTIMLYELFGRPEAPEPPEAGEGDAAEPEAPGRARSGGRRRANRRGVLRKGSPDRNPSQPASPEMRRATLDALAGHLRVMGYPFHDASLEEEMTKLSDILERASLEEWEARFLLGMFKHLRVQFERLRA